MATLLGGGGRPRRPKLTIAGVAGRIPQAFLDELLARVDIVELIGQRLPLKRAGREFKALCPFHDERTPSFTVSPRKQFYHCFGCGAHGDAIRFLMEYEHLSFRDAVEELAGLVGMRLPEPARGEAEDGAELYRILERAAELYREQLAENESARRYLETRGFRLRSPSASDWATRPPARTGSCAAWGAMSARARLCSLRDWCPKA